MAWWKVDECDRWTNFTTAHVIAFAASDASLKIVLIAHALSLEVLRALCREGRGLGNVDRQEHRQ